MEVVVLLKHIISVWAAWEQLSIEAKQAEEAAGTYQYINT